MALAAFDVCSTNTIRMATAVAKHRGRRIHRCIVLRFIFVVFELRLLCEEGYLGVSNRCDKVCDKVKDN